MTGRAGGRIAERFASLRAEGRAGLVTFVTAGDPDPETSAALLAQLPAAGADLIELGMPFSDPMADGPAIQAANDRALRAGQTLKRTLAMVAELRRRDDATPVVLMGYFNPIYRYGTEAFARDAAAAGVDGMIVVDLPPEEDPELRVPAEAAGLSVIRLVTPATDDARLHRILVDCEGFVYYVAVTGVTGTKSAALAAIARGIERVRAASDLPVAVGFGVRTAGQAAEIAEIADCVVVGSSIVQRVAGALNADGRGSARTVAEVEALVAELAGGIRGAAKARK